MTQIPSFQFADWAKRMAAGEHLEEEMQNAGIIPNALTPLPPTNATLHMREGETGYGTPNRTTIAVCGLVVPHKDGFDEHKFFFRDDPSAWHRKINCTRCRELLNMETTNG